MPLTAKGEEIMANMKKQYGAKGGEKIFYASKNKGSISGVDSADCDAKLDAILAHCDAYDNKDCS